MVEEDLLLLVRDLEAVEDGLELFLILVHLLEEILYEALRCGNVRLVGCHRCTR